MHRHSSFHKRKILDQTESGEIAEGIPVVPTTVSAISYNRSNNSVFEKASTIHARKIPLLDIRKRLLEKHEKLGILRISASDGEQMTRYMKMWHDCQSRSLQERLEFLLQGVAWKKIKTRSLDKLLASDLKKELILRGASITGKKKPALEKDFDELRAGIANFPALLQQNPNVTLQSLNLDHYEISPSEPLHDLKGHLGNIIEEALVVATGDVVVELKKVKMSVLSKETIRASDLRKAVILIYLKLKELQPDSMLTDLFCTAVEISSICYGHDAMRTPRSVLLLYNRSFLHAHYCSVQFADPKSTTHRKMFGRYFHSLTSHAASLFRIVSLRSLNTEQHERTFQQAKGITKATSNNHPEQVLISKRARSNYSLRH